MLDTTVIPAEPQERAGTQIFDLNSNFKLEVTDKYLTQKVFTRDQAPAWKCIGMLSRGINYHLDKAREQKPCGPASQGPSFFVTKVLLGNAWGSFHAKYHKPSRLSLSKLLFEHGSSI